MPRSFSLLVLALPGLLFAEARGRANSARAGESASYPWLGAKPEGSIGSRVPVPREPVRNLRHRPSRPSGRGCFGSGDGFFGSFVNPRIDDSERPCQVASRPFLLPQGGAS